MTPREKAQELVDKHCDSIAVWNLNSEYSLHDIAKQCALICVDEFLSFQDSLYLTEGSLGYQYWQQVKQEIENL